MGKIFGSLSMKLNNTFIIVHKKIFLIAFDIIMYY